MGRAWALHVLLLVVVVGLALGEDSEDVSSLTPAFKMNSAEMQAIMKKIKAKKTAETLREVQRNHRLLKDQERLVTTELEAGADPNNLAMTEISEAAQAEVQAEEHLRMQNLMKAKSKAKSKVSRALSKLKAKSLAAAKATVAAEAQFIKNPLSQFTSDRLSYARKEGVRHRAMMRHRGNLLMRYLPEAFGVGAGGGIAEGRVPGPGGGAEKPNELFYNSASSMQPPSGPFSQQTGFGASSTGRIQTLNTDVEQAALVSGLPDNYLLRGKAPLPFTPNFAFQKPQANLMGNRPADGAFLAPAGNYMNEYHTLNPFSMSGQESAMPQLAPPPVGAAAGVRR